MMNGRDHHYLSGPIIIYLIRNADPFNSSVSIYCRPSYFVLSTDCRRRQSMHELWASVALDLDSSRHIFVWTSVFHVESSNPRGIDANHKDKHKVKVKVKLKVDWLDDDDFDAQCPTVPNSWYYISIARCYHNTIDDWLIYHRYHTWKWIQRNLSNFRGMQ